MAPLPGHLSAVPVGRERIPAEELDAQKRSRVLDAAAPVFAARGFRATTVDDLVAAARIGVGSFYSIFDGKRGCFLALYDRTVAESRREILAAIPEGAPWAERYRAGLRRLLELAAGDPERARVVLVEAETAGPDAEARRSELLAEVAGALAGARELERAGDPLPARFESVTAAGLAWLLHQRLASGDTPRVEELLPEMTRIVLEAYPD